MYVKVEPRPYRMVARAAAAAARGDRILDAAIAIFWERPTVEISLDEVARRGGVSVQTVIRRFGGKEGLFAAAVEREAARTRNQRDAAIGAGLTEAVRVLVDHYEELGDRVLRMLAEEDRIPALREIADRGRAFHRDWCAAVFAEALGNRRGGARARLHAQLVAICDVYTWKLLRRDAGLSRRQGELALVEMLRPLTEEGW